MDMTPEDIGDLQCLYYEDTGYAYWFMWRREDGVVTYYTEPWGSYFSYYVEHLVTDTLALPKEYAL